MRVLSIYYPFSLSYYGGFNDEHYPFNKLGPAPPRPITPACPALPAPTHPRMYVCVRACVRACVGAWVRACMYVCHMTIPIGYVIRHWSHTNLTLTFLKPFFLLYYVSCLSRAKWLEYVNHVLSLIVIMKCGLNVNWSSSVSELT